MESKENKIGYGDSGIIFDDLANLIADAMKKESATEIGKRFNRDRKAMYFLRDGCGFRCDVDFVGGIRSLGYDLRLIKMVDDAGSTQNAAHRASRKKCEEILELAERDMIASRDIVGMRDLFDASTNDLFQICYTMEIVLSYLYEQGEETPHREAFSLLWRNLLSVRDKMSAACMNGAAWEAALKAQRRLTALSSVLL